MSEAEKKFNETIAGMYLTKNGNFLSFTVDHKTLEQVSKLQLGDKLIFRTPKGPKKKDTHPDAYIEIMPKETVDRFKAEFEARKASEAAAGSNPPADSL